MKAFFEAIQWLFENIFFALHNFLRQLELSSWFGANILNWCFMGICVYYMVFWIKQLKLHEENGEENQDTTAHSFLTK
jgi:Family of unknown function (DUF6341)